jgi:hypothetical protein
MCMNNKFYVNLIASCVNPHILYRPRPVPCPGTHLANVFLLRTPNDANRIHAIANNKEVLTSKYFSCI